jgi:hypothetical protein
MGFNSATLIVLIFLLALYSCHEGLSPSDNDNLPNTARLEGTVYFKGGANDWPPEDSVKAVRIVAFKNFPPKDVIQEILSGNAYFTLSSVPLFGDSANFSINITDTPVLLNYIAAAQQYTDSITAQRVIGVYSETNDNTKPSLLSIDGGKTYRIKIYVDWNNLPPQPFE